MLQFLLTQIGKIKAAASSLNSKLSNKIKWIDLELTNFTIGENGYSSITNPATPTGYYLMFAEIHAATYSSPGDFPKVEGRGGYVYGTANKTYTTITVRFFYSAI